MRTVIPPMTIAKPRSPSGKPTGSMIIVTLRPSPTTMSTKPGDHEERMLEETDNERPNAAGRENV